MVHTACAYGLHTCLAFRCYACVLYASTTEWGWATFHFHFPRDRWLAVVLKGRAAAGCRRLAALERSDLVRHVGAVRDVCRRTPAGLRLAVFRIGTLLITIDLEMCWLKHATAYPSRSGSMMRKVSDSPCLPSESYSLRLIWKPVG
jgi:hypothetical protein